MLYLCFLQDMIKALTKIDYLTFGFLLITALIITIDNSVISHTSLIIIRLITLTAICGVIYLNLKIKNPLLDFIRKTYPIYISGYFYQETVNYGKFFSSSFDPFFANIEQLLFSSQPSIEFSIAIPMQWFSELMHFGYFSYYIIIFGFCLYIFLYKKEFVEKIAFIISASFFIYYLVFAFIPVAGPQYYFDSTLTMVPDGYLFSNIMHFIQETAQDKECFS